MSSNDIINDFNNNLVKSHTEDIEKTKQNKGIIQTYREWEYDDLEAELNAKLQGIDHMQPYSAPEKSNIKSLISNYNDKVLFVITTVIMVICLFIIVIDSYPAPIFSIIAVLCLIYNIVMIALFIKQNNDNYKRRYKKWQNQVNDWEAYKNKLKSETIKQYAEYANNLEKYGKRESPNKTLLKCPRCGSNAVVTGKRGWSIWTGLLFSGSTVNRCGKCGYKWEPVYKKQK